jgi:hypothetical protein
MLVAPGNLVQIEHQLLADIAPAAYSDPASSLARLAILLAELVSM